MKIGTVFQIFIYCIQGHFFTSDTFPITHLREHRGEFQTLQLCSITCYIHLTCFVEKEYTLRAQLGCSHSVFHAIWDVLVY